MLKNHKGDTVGVVIDGVRFSGKIKQVVFREGPLESFLVGQRVERKSRRSIKYRVEVPGRGDSFYFFENEVEEV